MPDTEAIAPIVVLLVLLAGIRLVRAAPLPMLLAVCLLGAAVDTGVVEPPRIGALERARADVAAWQDERAAGLSCAAGAREALDLPDDEALALLERHCPGVAAHR